MAQDPSTAILSPSGRPAAEPQATEASNGRRDRWLAISLRVVLLGLFLWVVGGLLVPVAVGGIFALLLHPVHARLSAETHDRWSGLSALLLTLATLLLVVLPATFVVTQAVQSLSELMQQDWAGWIDAAERFIARKLAGFDVKTHEVRDGAAQLGGRLGTAITGIVGAIATSLPTVFVSVFLFAVALYYFLRDGRALVRYLIRLAPFHPEQTIELFKSINDTVKGAILGSLLSATCQAALLTIAYAIFGIPGPVLFGVIAFVLAFVPFLGTIPLTVGGIIYLFATEGIGAAAGMLVAALIIGNVDNIVQPWVQHARTKMHPLIVLLAIFGGIAVFGPAGIFLGPVAAAMALWTLDGYRTIFRQVRSGPGPGPAPAPASGAALTPSEA